MAKTAIGLFENSEVVDRVVRELEALGSAQRRSRRSRAAGYSAGWSPGHSYTRILKWIYCGIFWGLGSPERTRKIMFRACGTERS